jgi:hypothetical protein
LSTGFLARTKEPKGRLHLDGAAGLRSQGRVQLRHPDCNPRGRQAATARCPHARNPSRDVTAYTSKFGLGCVLIAATPSGLPPVAVGAGLDIGSMIGARARRYPEDEPLSLHAAWWSNERQQVERVAKRAGVPLVDHAAVMAKVGAAVGKIEDRVEASRENGTLAGFNAEYRRRRQEAMKAGRRFMRTTWRWRD